MAPIGPNPISIGSRPTCAKATILAKGFKFLLFTCLSLHNTRAAAPSLIPEAFPAVTDPDGSNAGLSFDKLSKVELNFGNSSDWISLPDLFSRTGTISLVKWPSSMLFLAFVCEESAYLSWDCLEMLCACAKCSAEKDMYVKSDMPRPHQIGKRRSCQFKIRSI